MMAYFYGAAGILRDISPPLVRPAVQLALAGIGALSPAAQRRQDRPEMALSGRGGIGRRAGFRFQWRKSWGFESLRPHHAEGRTFNSDTSGAVGLCKTDATRVRQQ